jgi:pimeloyl-ACP methyl ester carboxylesterase
LVTPDRPATWARPLGGNGSSSAQADVAAALLDMLEVERVAVVGISAGGSAVIQFAARHPERTRALVLAVRGLLRTPLSEDQLDSALGRLVMTRRFQDPAYFLIRQGDENACRPRS